MAAVHFLNGEMIIEKKPKRNRPSIEEELFSQSPKTETKKESKMKQPNFDKMGNLNTRFSKNLHLDTDLDLRSIDQDKFNKVTRYLELLNLVDNTVLKNHVYQLLINDNCYLSLTETQKDYISKRYQLDEKFDIETIFALSKIMLEYSKISNRNMKSLLHDDTSKYVKTIINIGKIEDITNSSLTNSTNVNIEKIKSITAYLVKDIFTYKSGDFKRNETITKEASSDLFVRISRDDLVNIASASNVINRNGHREIIGHADDILERICKLIKWHSEYYVAQNGDVYGKRSDGPLNVSNTNWELVFGENFHDVAHVCNRAIADSFKARLKEYETYTVPDISVDNIKEVLFRTFGIHLTSQMEERLRCNDEELDYIQKAYYIIYDKFKYGKVKDYELPSTFEQRDKWFIKEAEYALRELASKNENFNKVCLESKDKLTEPKSLYNLPSIGVNEITYFNFTNKEINIHTPKSVFVLKPFPKADSLRSSYLSTNSQIENELMLKNIIKEAYSITKGNELAEPDNKSANDLYNTLITILPLDGKKWQNTDTDFIAINNTVITTFDEVISINNYYSNLLENYSKYNIEDNDIVYLKEQANAYNNIINLMIENERKNFNNEISVSNAKHKLTGRVIKFEIIKIIKKEDLAKINKNYIPSIDSVISVGNLSENMNAWTSNPKTSGNGSFEQGVLFGADVADNLLKEEMNKRTPNGTIEIVVRGKNFISSGKERFNETISFYQCIGKTVVKLLPNSTPCQKDEGIYIYGNKITLSGDISDNELVKFIPFNYDDDKLSDEVIKEMSDFGIFSNLDAARAHVLKSDLEYKKLDANAKELDTKNKELDNKSKISDDTTKTSKLKFVTTLIQTVTSILTSSIGVFVVNAVKMMIKGSV